MPVWLAILLGSVPGVFGLAVALIHVGSLRNEVKNIAEKVQRLPDMISDIAYMKGRLDGADQASVLDVLRPRIAPTPGTRPRLRAAK